MALLFVDGFGTWYNIASSAMASAASKGWTATGSNGAARQPGRYTGTYSVQFGSGATLSNALTSSGSTTIVGFGLKPPGGTMTPVLSVYNGNTYVTIWTTAVASPELQIWTGGPPSGSQTQQFTTSTGGLSTSVFCYVELKVIWAGPSTGRVVLKVNGIQQWDSGATLNLGSTANITTIWLGYSTATTTYSIADLLVMDGGGTTFNDFQGDIRIEPLVPKADGTNTGFTTQGTNLLPNINVSRLATDATGWSNGARTASGVGWTDTTKFPYYNSVTGAASVSQPTGASGFAVTAGATYGLTVWCYNQGGGYFTFIYMRFFNSGGTQIGGDVAASGGGFVAYQVSGQWGWMWGNCVAPAGAVTASVVVSDNGSPGGHNFTGVCVVAGSISGPLYVDPGTTHYTAVLENGSDGDATQNMSNTLNAKDTYQMTSMVSTAGAILGVCSCLVARKDSAPQRALTPVVRVGGTDYQGATAFTLPASLAYAYGQNVWTVSPASGTAWTRTEINAMELGAQVTT